MLLTRDRTLLSHWYWFVSSWHQSQQHHSNNDAMRCTWGITESTLYAICAIGLSWEWDSGQSKTGKMNITCTPATGLRVSMSHLILPITPSHVSDWLINFSDSSVQLRPIWAFSVMDVSPWSCGMGVTLWIGKWSGRGKGCLGPVDGSCHDPHVAMDYFFFLHTPLFSFRLTLCAWTGLLLVYSYTLTHDVR